MTSTKQLLALVLVLGIGHLIQPTVANHNSCCPAGWASVGNKCYKRLPGLVRTNRPFSTHHKKTRRMCKKMGATVFNYNRRAAEVIDAMSFGRPQNMFWTDGVHPRKNIWLFKTENGFQRARKLEHQSAKRGRDYKCLAYNAEEDLHQPRPCNEANPVICEKGIEPMFNPTTPGELCMGCTMCGTPVEEGVCEAAGVSTEANGHLVSGLTFADQQHIILKVTCNGDCTGIEVEVDYITGLGWIFMEVADPIPNSDPFCNSGFRTCLAFENFIPSTIIPRYQDTFSIPDAGSPTFHVSLGAARHPGDIAIDIQGDNIIDISCHAVYDTDFF